MVSITAFVGSGRVDAARASISEAEAVAISLEAMLM